jgi:N-acetylneuraminic acid mutarotase
MRTALSLLRLPLACALIAAATAGTHAASWEVRAPIPHHVYGHSAAVVAGKLHILGGCHTPNWQIPAPHHQIYDPATDAWIQAAELPVPVAWAMPAVHNGRIYLFGGGVYQPPQGITSTSKAWVFDPIANRWEPLRELPIPIMNGFAATVGDSIYIGLGYNRQGGEGRDIVAHYRHTYSYDPADDSYQRVADAPKFGCYAAVGVWNSQIYVVNGAEIEIGFHDMEEYVWAEGALKYDPAIDRWMRIDAPRIKQRVFYMTQCTSSAVFGSKLFAVGGMGAKRDRTTVADYLDMEQEVFRELPPIPAPRCCGGGGVVGPLLILAGGFHGAAENLGDVCDTTWVLDVSRLPER